LVKSIVAISLGASLEATLRWGLGVLLNTIFPIIPLGTLTANLLEQFHFEIVLAAGRMRRRPPMWRRRNRVSP
jgi:CrcB protein